MRHITHNGARWSKDCPACIKRDKLQANKLLNAQLKAIQYNDMHDELKPYLKSYNKALKELWGQPISNNDKIVLEGYGLITNNASTLYHTVRYDWSPDLKQLNKRYRARL